MSLGLDDAKIELELTFLFFQRRRDRIAQADLILAIDGRNPAFIPVVEFLKPVHRSGVWRQAHGAGRYVPVDHADAPDLFGKRQKLGAFNGTERSWDFRHGLSAQNALGLRHRPQLAGGGATRQVIKAARAGDYGLFRRQPFVLADARGNGFAAFDLGVLHVNRTDAELVISQQPFVMPRHIVFDQIRGRTDLADQIGLIAARIEIAMADLAIVVLADRVVALTDVGRGVNVPRQPLNRPVDGVDRRIDFGIVRQREQRLVDLDMPTAGARPAASNCNVAAC